VLVVSTASVETGVDTALLVSPGRAGVETTGVDAVLPPSALTPLSGRSRDFPAVRRGATRHAGLESDRRVACCPRPVPLAESGRTPQNPGLKNFGPLSIDHGFE
jgi:hypothetical protein